MPVALAPDDVVRTHEQGRANEREPLLVIEPLLAFLRAHGLEAPDQLTAEPIGDGHSNVTFALSTALVAISDIIWQKLQPHLEEFDRFMLKLVLPALKGLADAVGLVTQALIWLAKTAGPTGSGRRGKRAAPRKSAPSMGPTRPNPGSA